MTKDEEGTDDETTCSCLDDEETATDDNRRTNAYHIVRTYLACPLLASSHQPAHCRYKGSPFLISPDPLPPALLYLLASYIPPPPGRGTRRLISVSTSGRRRNPPASNRIATLTHCVRSLSARCLLANGSDDGATDETRKPDEERDDGRDEERD